MKNILFLTIDCLRYDLLLKNLEKLPNFKSIIEKGQLIKCYTTGTCTPVVFPSVWTSTYPSMYDGTFDVSKRGCSIFQVLRKNGYYAFGLSDGNSFISKRFSYHKIFDEWIDLLDRYKKYTKAKTTRIKRMLWGQFSFFSDPNELFDILLNRVATKNKWVAWIHLMNLHGPHFSPRKNIVYRIMEIAAQWKARRSPGTISCKILHKAYLNVLRYIDSALAKLGDLLFDRKLALFIFGDHGDSLGEKGVYGHNHGIPYKEVVEVPLITNFKRPRVIQPASLIDLTPSVLKLVGLKPTKDMVGKNFFRSKREFIYIEGYPIELHKVPKKIEGRTIPCVIHDGLKLWVDNKVNLVDTSDNPVSNPRMERLLLQRIIEFRKTIKAHTKAPLSNLPSK